MKKIIVALVLFTSDGWAQKFNFGPIFTVFNEKSIGFERVNNKYIVNYGDNKVKEKPKIGVFFEYQLSKYLSTTANIQFSKPSNEISIFGYSTDSRQNKLLVYEDKRINTELLYPPHQFRHPI